MNDYNAADSIESVRGEVLRIWDTVTDEERLEHLLEAVKNEGIQEGVRAAREEGIRANNEATARALLGMGLLSTEQIAQATRLSVREVREIAEKDGLA